MKRSIVTIFIFLGTRLFFSMAWAADGDAIKWRQVPDMAFELTVPYAPPPPLAPVKWQQRPYMEQGVNLLSIAGDDSRVTVADDWLCLDGSPVMDLHFWGSYPGWMDGVPAPVEPTPGVKAFRIQIYSDVPALSPADFSRPGSA